MNTLNFINPLPPKKQAELQRWYNQTLYILGFTTLILISFSCYQWWCMHIVYKKYAALKKKIASSTLEGNLKEAQNKVSLFEKRLQKLQTLKNSSKKPTLFLETLANLTPQTIALTRCILQKKEFELEGQAFNTHDVILFVKKLSGEVLFKKATLTSLVQDTGSGNEQGLVRFVIKGAG